VKRNGGGDAVQTCALWDVRRCDADSESKGDSDGESDTDSETDEDSETVADSARDTGSITSSDTDSATNTDMGTDTDSQTDTATEQTTETDSETDYCAQHFCWRVPPTHVTSCCDDEAIISCPGFPCDEDGLPAFCGQDAHYPDNDQTLTCHELLLMNQELSYVPQSLAAISRRA
jgi:hypothetical protein